MRHDGMRNSATEAPIDDCWNRIGVRGDRSCERLTEYVHCRNCPVFEAAAAAQRDRLSVEIEAEALDTATTALATGRSYTIFRLADAWLALPTRALDAIIEPSPVHALPHARANALLGVTNVNGTLAPCFDLKRLFQIAPASQGDARGRSVAQVLILGGAHGRVAAPVDEVAEITRIPDDDIQAPGKDTAEPLQSVTLGVARCGARSVTLIDPDQLAARINACFG